VGIPFFETPQNSGGKNIPDNMPNCTLKNWNGSLHVYEIVSKTTILAATTQHWYTLV
jgi:hypothetical protein